MDEPRSLDGFFTQKMFRIPDYQRGYAWQRGQLNDFWEDLVNLSESRSHYTGVITLREVPASEVAPENREYWLVQGHSYRLYHIVDGQQRLTTFVICIQAIIDFVRSLPEHIEKSDRDIYIDAALGLSLSAAQDKFLFKSKPLGESFRTYKFGYAADNPSYQYLRYNIFGEPGAGTVQETFYTLNLNNAKAYFDQQLKALYVQEGMGGITDIYRTLTQRFLVNEYVIRDEFDVFVAFETMNNRGRKLSDLELLKNRLIYLTTLYDDSELELDDRDSLREGINSAWKEIYFQLGRNKNRPLNDDDFLRAHWTMYFKFSRKKGNDYIRYLLDDEFTPKRVHKKVEKLVTLEAAVEPPTDEAGEINESVQMEAVCSEQSNAKAVMASQLPPAAIHDYINSLRESVKHWFTSYYPELVSEVGSEERQWLERLNRLGMVYFRPLVMAILKNVDNSPERVMAFKSIERFLFVAFRLSLSRTNYKSSEFSNAARSVDRKKMTVSELSSQLNEALDWLHFEDESFDSNEFNQVMEKKFKTGLGYYSWSGLRYFLYEYELSLMTDDKLKVSWDSLLRTSKDRLSIEHIYPKKSQGWSDSFDALPGEQQARYRDSLGNLLLLSQSINSSMQNASFSDKKSKKLNQDGSVARRGFCDGSHSEIEVATLAEWTPDAIRKRGIKLLKFMEKRWAIDLGKKKDRRGLLFLEPETED